MFFEQCWGAWPNIWYQYIKNHIWRDKESKKRRKLLCFCWLYGLAELRNHVRIPLYFGPTLKGSLYMPGTTLFSLTKTTFSGWCSVFGIPGALWFPRLRVRRRSLCCDGRKRASVTGGECFPRPWKYASYRPQANWENQFLYIYWDHTFQMATAIAMHILGP